MGFFLFHVLLRQPLSLSLDPLGDLPRSLVKTRGVFQSQFARQHFFSPGVGAAFHSDASCFFLWRQPHPTNSTLPSGSALGYRVEALGMSDYSFTRDKHVFHVVAHNIIPFSLAFKQIELSSHHSYGAARGSLNHRSSLAFPSRRGVTFDATDRGYTFRHFLLQGMHLPVIFGSGIRALRTFA